MLSSSFEYTDWSPAEVQTISGVKVETQRNWRRLKHLESTGEGWNRFPSYELALLLVMAKLVAWPLPAATAKLIAVEAAPRVMLFALDVPGAAVDEHGDPVTEKPVKTSWHFSLETYLVAAGSHMRFVANVDDYFADFPEAETAIVLDLKRLGTTLATRAGRPLVIQRRDD